MKIRDLLSIDIKQEIRTIFSNTPEDVAGEFEAMWKLELRKYSDFDLLVESEAAQEAYKAFAISTYFDNKSELMLWNELDNFKNVSEFKKKNTQTDRRQIDGNTSANNNSTLSTGFRGYGVTNQTGQFGKDTTTENNSGTYNSTDNFSRTLTDDDPELAVRVLRANIKTSIIKNVKSYLLDYAKVME